MWCSENMVSGFPFIIGGIVLFAVSVHFIKKTEKGGFFFDLLKLKAPLFGPLINKTAIARFARTLSTLMDSGVPVLQALTIVGETSGNAVIARGVQTVHDAVKEGENMAPPIDSTGLFPPMVTSMVEVGEETGDLPQMLHRIADTYDDEVDNAVAALTSIIEPILIIFLAVIVGTIVIALFMPLISIIGGLS
jgi:type IV pilus assembly protein PilC